MHRVQCIVRSKVKRAASDDRTVIQEMVTSVFRFLYGPLPSGEYLRVLVVLDEYFRFPEVEIVKSLSARTVIPIFDKVFSSRGIPDNLKIDNGTPFQRKLCQRSWLSTPAYHAILARG